MSNNTTFWLAIDEDGEENIYSDEPERIITRGVGLYWYSEYGSVKLPTGQIKAWGYNLKPGECMEVTGPNYDPSPVNAILEH